MENSTSLTKIFRNSLSKFLLEKLKNVEIDPLRVKLITDEIDKILPAETNDEQLLSILPEFLTKYPELQPIIEELRRTRIDNLKADILNKVDDLMKQGQINKANETLEKVEKIV